MVVLVHGGPWKRVLWGSNAGVVQWLANRGYAVLHINFRGSTGYGKVFSNKGEDSSATVTLKPLSYCLSRTHLHNGV